MCVLTPQVIAELGDRGRLGAGGCVFGMMCLRNGGVGRQFAPLLARIEAIKAQIQKISRAYRVPGECGKRVTTGHACLGNHFP